VDGSRLLDLAALDAVHEEICVALAQVPSKYTGGSHRSMLIVPPGRAADVPEHGDYGEVIAAMTAESYRTFRALAEVPESFPETQQGASFGEERTHPLSRAQMRWLEVRHGVYFPWKTFVELMPVERWEDKDRAGRFTWEAETFFPKTLAFLKSLPLAHIGRASIMGLQSFDHGTVHRDGEHPDSPSEFLMFCPAENKELFLWDEQAKHETVVRARAYWFNDCDYHGVRSAPYFRYSVRVDGPFTDSFRTQIEAHCKQERGA
jgi:hypothetical protein